MLYLVTIERLYGSWGVVVRPMSEVVNFRMLCKTSEDVASVEFAVKSAEGHKVHEVKWGSIVTEESLLREMQTFESFATEDNEEELEPKEAKDGRAQAD